MGIDEEFWWHDPNVTYEGPKWECANIMGISAGGVSLPDWKQVEPILESLWRDFGDMPWNEARPAIYAAWRAEKLKRTR